MCALSCSNLSCYVVLCMHKELHKPHKFLPVWCVDPWRGASIEAGSIHAVIARQAPAERP